MIALGGDGTLLRVSSLFDAGAVPPVLGINMGSLGFLMQTRQYILLAFVLRLTTENRYRIIPVRSRRIARIESFVVAEDEAAVCCDGYGRISDRPRQWEYDR